jgi:hypothetical protein
VFNVQCKILNDPSESYEEPITNKLTILHRLAVSVEGVERNVTVLQFLVIQFGTG